MTLALIHDIPVWTLAPAADRKKLYRQLDKFGVADSRFLGYWDLSRSWRDSPILVSAYLHKTSGRALLIVANRQAQSHHFGSGELAALLDASTVPPTLQALAAHLDDQAGQITIPAHDFALVELK